MTTSNLSENISIFTNNLVSNASDLMLLSIKYNFTFSFVEENFSSDIEREALEAFQKTRFKSLKRSLRHLKTKGLIEINPTSSPPYLITIKGREYLAKIIPDYKIERPWNNRIYLVNYDVPRTNNRARNTLREFLKSIGCALLQHSLWIVPTNPKEKLETFKTNNNLHDALIVVSSFNQEDGGVLGKNITQAILESYKLNEVNLAYQNFIDFSMQPLARERLIFHFLNALKTDPQLPFELYPPNWTGHRAFDIFKKLI